MQKKGVTYYMTSIYVLGDARFTSLILFNMGLFGAPRGWGGGKKPLSLKCVTDILH